MRKRQNYRSYSIETKEKVMKLYKAGIRGKVLAQKFKIPARTIYTWAYYDRHLKPFMPTHHARTRLNEQDYKERYEILKKYQAYLQAQRKKK